MSSANLARTWMSIVGVSLVAAGILGFIPNPITGSGPDAFVRVNALHNLIHVATGAVALGIALRLEPASRPMATAAFGVVYLLVLVLGVVDPTLFGLLADAPINGVDHVLHATAGIVSLVLGLSARNSAPAFAR